jgi:hypothetical protein
MHLIGSFTEFRHRAYHAQKDASLESKCFHLALRVSALRKRIYVCSTNLLVSVELLRASSAASLYSPYPFLPSVDMLQVASKAHADDRAL